MTTATMKKPHDDRPIEGIMAKWYATNTGQMMKEYVELAQRLAGQLPPGSAVLEVAPGPGYLSIELAKLGSYAITGLDISHSMVKIAGEKAAKAGVKVDFKQGSASNLPFPKDSFDFLVCRAAFKNFAKPVVALQEMCRVLKPGGRAIIIDLRGDAEPNAVGRYVNGMGLSRMSRIMTKAVFRWMLIKSAYTKEQFQHMLAQTEFGSVDIVEAEIGFEITMTKKPLARARQHPVLRGRSSCRSCSERMRELKPQVKSRWSGEFRPCAAAFAWAQSARKRRAPRRETDSTPIRAAERPSETVPTGRRSRERCSLAGQNGSGRRRHCGL